jgi:hypothetical protein
MSGELQKYTNQAANVLARIENIESIEITSEAEQTNCEDMRTLTRRIIKEANVARLARGAPLRQMLKDIDGDWAELLEKLNKADSIFTPALKVWAVKQDAIAEQRRIEAAAVQAEAVKTGEIVQQAPVNAPAPTHHSNVGTTHYEDDCEVEILDPMAVDRDLCVPSIELIKAAWLGGRKIIAGCNITPSKKLTGRLSR